MNGEELIGRIERVATKARRLSLVLGLGWVVVTLVAVLLGVLLIDYALRLPAVPRTMLVLSGLFAVGLVAWRKLVRPQRNAADVDMIAGRVESIYPAFEGRLRSAVAFVRASVPGSDRMQAKVIDEACAIASNVRMDRVLEPAIAMRWIIAASLSLLFALSGFFSLNDQLRGIVLNRLFNPLAKAEWPNRVEIAFAGEIPTEWPAGQSLEIPLVVRRGDSSRLAPVMIVVDESGSERREQMSRDASGRFVAKLTPRLRDAERAGAWQVRVRAGDGETESIRFEVLPRPVLSRAWVEIEPPAYVNRVLAERGAAKSGRVSPLPESIEVVEGSRVRLGLSSNRPIKPDGVSVEAIRPSGDVAEDVEIVVSGADRTFEIDWVVRESLGLRVEATDVRGVRSANTREIPVVVKPDALPRIVIENPRDAGDRTADAIVPLAAMVEDDFGLDWISLCVTRVGSEDAEAVIPLVGGGERRGDRASVVWNVLDGEGTVRRFRLRDVLALRELAAAVGEPSEGAGLEPGTVLEIWLRGQDNYEMDGIRHPTVESQRVRLRIISQDQLTARAMDELRAARAAVTQARNATDRSRSEAGDLARDLAGKQTSDEADRAIARRLQQQQSGAASMVRQAADRLDQLAERLTENRPGMEAGSDPLRDLSREVSDQLRETAGESMRAAMQALGRSGESGRSAGDRVKELKDAEERQRQASYELTRAIERLEDAGSLEQMLESAQRLLENQRKLSREADAVMQRNAGRSVQDVSAEDREALARIAGEQEKAADRTDALAERMEQTAEQLSKSDPSTAEAMRQAARSARSQQTSQQQRSAAGSVGQNRGSSARQSQQQAELGLQQIVGQLRGAQQRKLEELKKKIAELREQIERLIKRQAGHNLDNLTIQGPAAVREVGERLFADWLRLSGREDAVAIEDLRTERLVTQQSQTERNTRDIGTKAADMEDGAEPSARLVRAATLMERALVSLRDVNAAGPAWATALDAQSAALVALLEANDIVLEQERKNDEQIMARQTEAIRAAFERIREEHVKVMAETQRIESARDEAGRLGRADNGRLGRLPSEQGIVAEGLRAQQQQLEGLQSTIFVWTNDRAIGRTEDARQKIAEGMTSRTTQALQASVLKDIDAILAGLKIEPREKRFENAAGGGQGEGGAGQPPAEVPTEAELRLAKALQEGINDQTKSIDATIAETMRVSDARQGDIPDADAQAARAAEEKAMTEIKTALSRLGEEQSSLRGVLDEMLSRASRGQVTLGEEPTDVSGLLNEDGKSEEDASLESDLLGGDAGADLQDQLVRRLGEGMTRSRVRLEVARDPGSRTQEIQAKILRDLDALIEQARQQQGGGRSNASASQGQGNRPQPGKGEEQSQASGQSSESGSASASSASSAGSAGGNAAGRRDDGRSGTSLEETAEEWGRISPRLRGPVLESRDDEIVERYRRLIEDYSRSISVESSGGGSTGGGR
jgi:hypothetical protein